jgi:hypothetical protein
MEQKARAWEYLSFCYSGVSGSGAPAACIVCNSKKKVLTDKDKEHWTGKPEEPSIEC